MKKLIATLAVAAAAVPTLSFAAAAASGDVCTGNATGGQASVSPATFIKVAFTQKCSNNVYLSWQDDATTIAVASASAKGANVFGGGSNGGGISPLNACAATSGCTAADAQTGSTTAYNAASSS